MSFNKDKKVIQNLLGDGFEREKEIIWTSPHRTKIVNKNTHSRGVLSMARSQDPNSAGSQFFIVLKDSKFLVYS